MLEDAIPTTVFGVIVDNDAAAATEAWNDSIAIGEVVEGAAVGADDTPVVQAVAVAVPVAVVTGSLAVRGDYTRLGARVGAPTQPLLVSSFR